MIVTGGNGRFAKVLKKKKRNAKFIFWTLFQGLGAKRKAQGASTAMCDHGGDPGVPNAEVTYWAADR